MQYLKNFFLDLIILLTFIKNLYRCLNLAMHKKNVAFEVVIFHYLILIIFSNYKHLKKLNGKHINFLNALMEKFRAKYIFYYTKNFHPAVTHNNKCRRTLFHLLLIYIYQN